MTAPDPYNRSQTELDAIARVQALLDWYEQFDLAWSALEGQCLVGPWFGAEYRRVGAQALLAQVEPCQTALRLFILERADVGPTSSITAQSLAARESARNQTEDRKHDQ